jgi:hypothetical protein
MASRYECKNLLVDDVINQITKFFSCSKIQINLDNSIQYLLINKIISRLEILINDLKLINLYDIPAASLLIIYDVEDWTNMEIKIIDFSFYNLDLIENCKKINVIVKNEKNIIWSLQHIILFFKDLLQKES